MLGITFYLEYPNHKAKRKGTVKSPGDHTGNVVAVFNEESWLSQDNWHECHMTEDGKNWLDSGTRPTYQIMYGAVGALHFEPNSVVCGTSVSQNYLRRKAKRIPESLAREIHPNLFQYLDD